SAENQLPGRRLSRLIEGSQLLSGARMAPAQVMRRKYRMKRPLPLLPGFMRRRFHGHRGKMSMKLLELFEKDYSSVKTGRIFAPKPNGPSPRTPNSEENLRESAKSADDNSSTMSRDFEELDYR